MDQTERDAKLSQMAAERHQTVEELLADFYAMVMQAEATWEEAEGDEYDWREDAFLDGWGLGE